MYSVWLETSRTDIFIIRGSSDFQNEKFVWSDNNDLRFELLELTSIENLILGDAWPSVVVKGNVWFATDPQLMYRSICKYRKGKTSVLQRFLTTYVLRKYFHKHKML